MVEDQDLNKTRRDPKILDKNQPFKKEKPNLVMEECSKESQIDSAKVDLIAQLNIINKPGS